ncbi:hypothetical protein HPB50_005585 [Hyalomma asiaticum]|uniref:Uncharacterized protein n=1 Tax=Hyalomma asiaticum TaxID=266040 RepID=A0ACB7TFN5_HYAAI|nr:hypothetical protein HPB50_005585 [Hyalomma asiaticum]
MRTRLFPKESCSGTAISETSVDQGEAPHWAKITTLNAICKKPPWAPRLSPVNSRAAMPILAAFTKRCRSARGYPPKKASPPAKDGVPWRDTRETSHHACASHCRGATQRRATVQPNNARSRARG